MALVDDQSLSAIRVGATVGTGMKHLATKAAKRVAIFGSGRQARTNLEAVSRVRALKTVLVFSPTVAHRQCFAAEMTSLLGLLVTAVDTPQQAMAEADIVLCAANSPTPLFDGAWLRPGMTISTISSGAESAATAVWGRAGRPLDELTYQRSARIVGIGGQRAVSGPRLPTTTADKADMVELGDVLLGKAPGRMDASEIVLFANGANGSQFAALGAAVYESAKQHGSGWEIPTERLAAQIGS